MAAEMVDALQHTLDVVDPDKRAVLIGGAAIIWDLQRRGADVSSLLPLRDVDCVTRESDFNDIKARMRKQIGAAVSSREFDMKILGDTESGRLPVEVFSTQINYSNYTEVARREIHVRAILRDFMTEHEGRRYIKLPFVLWWKSLHDRPKDRDTIHRTLNILNNQQLATGTEWAEIMGRLNHTISSYKTDMSSYFPPEIFQRDKNID